MANKLIQLKNGSDLLFPKIVLASIYQNSAATAPFDFGKFALASDLTVLQGKVDALTSAAITREVVTALPAEGQKENVIYMITKANDSDEVANDGSIYNEYMWINGAWQLIGDTSIDLSGYVTTGDLDTKLGNYVTDTDLGTELAGYVTTGVLTEYKGEVTIALGNKADVSVVTGINTRLEAAEGEIDVLQAATEGFSGSNKISDAIAAKADASSVYTKEEANGLLSSKANAADVYTKGEADGLLAAKANSADVYGKGEVYTKAETDGLLSSKANSADVYTKEDANGLLAAKADASSVYTKEEANGLLAAKANSADVYTKEEVNTTLGNYVQYEDLGIVLD